MTSLELRCHCCKSTNSVSETFWKLCHQTTTSRQPPGNVGCSSFDRFFFFFPHFKGFVGQVCQNYAKDWNPSFYVKVTQFDTCLCAKTENLLTEISEISQKMFVNSGRCCGVIDDISNRVRIRYLMCCLLECILTPCTLQSHQQALLACIQSSLAMQSGVFICPDAALAKFLLLLVFCCNQAFLGNNHWKHWNLTRQFISNTDVRMVF